MKPQITTADPHAAIQALRVNEARLRMALDASNAGTWSWDVASNTSTGDDRYQELYGFGPNEPISFESWLARVEPQDREQLRAKIRCLLEPGAGDSWNEEFRAHHPVRGERWMANLGRVERDPNGRAVRMSGINLDITERKLIEEELRRTNAVLQAINEATENLICIKDSQGKILMANPAMCRFLGKPASALIGADDLDWLPDPEQAAQVRLNDLKILLEGRAATVEETIDQPDRRWHCLFTKSPYRDAEGQIIGLIGIGADITERKRAEEALRKAHDELEVRVRERTAELQAVNHALRESEGLYRTLFELSPDGILLEDSNGNILDANQALCRSFGYTRQELLGQNVRCFVPPDSHGTVQAHLATLQAGQGLEHEVWNVRKDGERCLMRLNETPLALPDGRRGILVVARDITQSQRAEMTKQVFLSLGEKLSAVRSPVEAARAVFAAADQLWKWLAAALDLYSPESDRIQSVLDCDVVDGTRREYPVSHPPGATSPRMLRVMRQGAELIRRTNTDPASTDSVGFGEARPTACKMYVPIRREGQALGVLSIQSYTPDAYDQEDLRTLQALADYCAGALERIRAGQALQQREELNRTIVATAMDGFYVLDFGLHPGGAFLEVNDAYCHLTGYSRQELLQRTMADLEAKESQEEMARHKELILSTGADRFETLHRRKDGQEVTVEVSVSKLAGTHQRMFGFVRDITERKRSELLKEAFLSLGTKLSAARSPIEAARAIYASTDLLWKWDSASLDLCSPGSERLQTVLNCDVVDGRRRDVLSNNLKGIPSPRMLRTLREGAHLILEEHPTQTGDIVPFGDSSRFSASMMYVPLRQEGRPVGVLSIQSYTPKAYTPEDLRTLQALADHCADALERIRAEEELRWSEERYRSLVNNLNVGVYRNTPGPQGRFIQINPALARMFGYESVAEFRQSTVSEHYQTPAERKAFVAEVLRQGTVVNHELPLKQKDGTPIWGSINATAHRDADGLVDWIDGVLEDITDRKRGEFLLQAQRDLGVSLSLATDLDTAFNLLLDISMEMRGIDCGGVYLLDRASGTMDLAAHRGVSPAFVAAVSHFTADDLRVQQLRQHQPLFGQQGALTLLPDEAFVREGMRAYAVLPLSHENRVIGALALASHSVNEIPARTKVVLEAIAAQAAGAIARIHAETEQRRLERQLLEISDREQARIGQDIHDGLCQYLVSLAFDANTLGSRLSLQAHPEAAIAQRLAELLDRAITESRQLSRGLFPIRLEGEGLVPALEELARTTRERFQVRCRLTSKAPVFIQDSTVATHLYRIAQEAVNNAVKHSRAKAISISLHARAGQLELKIADNGTGFAPGAAGTATGMGLHIMDYRARSIGGTLRSSPASSGGTLVCCCVPKAAASSPPK